MCSLSLWASSSRETIIWPLSWRKWPQVLRLSSNKSKRPGTRSKRLARLLKASKSRPSSSESVSKRPLIRIRQCKTSWPCFDRSLNSWLLPRVPQRSKPKAGSKIWPRSCKHQSLRFWQPSSFWRTSGRRIRNLTKSWLRRVNDTNSSRMTC